MVRMAQPVRYIGLDIHKRFLVAYGVDKEQNHVYGPVRVENGRIPRWIGRGLGPRDEVALEMTTNTWKMVDLLEPHVASVTVVHPPEVKAIVKARVMTDKKAARVLAQLHAAKLLPPVWIPPREVREVRALVAGRRNMVAMAIRAKNGLHGVLHAHHIEPPPVSNLFHPEMEAWWRGLALSPLEMLRVETEWENLAFANRQKARFEQALTHLAAVDDRVPLLVQLPGVSVVTAMTILGAIGVIGRFPSAQKLVGYAGLGAAVHASGQSRWSGRITKQGRRDLRRAMVDAAQHASRVHPHWSRVYQKLEPRIGKSKAKVAVARKMLVSVWYILTFEMADRYADPQQAAAGFFNLAYKLGVENLPQGMSARQFTRAQLDRLNIGQEMTHFYWGKKRYTLPPSRSAPG